MNIGALGPANVRMGLSLLSLLMVAMETLSELCIQVFTFLYQHLPLTLGFPFGLLSPTEYSRSGSREKPCIMPETLSWEGAQATRVEISHGGSYGTHRGTQPLRRNILFSKECS